MNETRSGTRCIDSARNRSIPGLPFQVCPRGTAVCVRNALLVPSRTSSSKMYLVLSFLTRKSNLYVHGVLTCAGCGGAYPSESRLVMGGGIDSRQSSASIRVPNLRVGNATAVLYSSCAESYAL